MVWGPHHFLQSICRNLRIFRHNFRVYVVTAVTFCGGWTEGRIRFRCRCWTLDQQNRAALWWHVLENFMESKSVLRLIFHVVLCWDPDLKIFWLRVHKLSLPIYIVTVTVLLNLLMCKRSPLNQDLLFFWSLPHQAHWNEGDGAKQHLNCGTEGQRWHKLWPNMAPDACTAVGAQYHTLWMHKEVQVEKIF